MNKRTFTVHEIENALTKTRVNRVPCTDYDDAERDFKRILGIAKEAETGDRVSLYSSPKPGEIGLVVDRETAQKILKAENYTAIDSYLNITSERTFVWLGAKLLVYRKVDLHIMEGPIRE